MKSILSLLLVFQVMLAAVASEKNKCFSLKYRIKKNLEFLNLLHAAPERKNFEKELENTKPEIIDFYEFKAKYGLEIPTSDDGWKEDMKLTGFDFNLFEGQFKFKLFKSQRYADEVPSAREASNRQIWKVFVYTRSLMQKVKLHLGEKYLPKRIEGQANLIVLSSPKRLDRSGSFHLPNFQGNVPIIHLQAFPEGWGNRLMPQAFVATTFVHEFGHFLAETWLPLLAGAKQENGRFTVFKEHLADSLAILFTEQAYIGRIRNIEDNIYYDMWGKSHQLKKFKDFRKEIQDFFKSGSSKDHPGLQAHNLSIYLSHEFWGKLAGKNELERWDLFKKWLDQLAGIEAAEVERLGKLELLDFVEYFLEKMQKL